MPAAIRHKQLPWVLEGPAVGLQDRQLALLVLAAAAAVLASADEWRCPADAAQ